MIQAYCRFSKQLYFTVDDIYAASEKVGIKTNCIRKCLDGKQKYVGRWIFKEITTEDRKAQLVWVKQQELKKRKLQDEREIKRST